jgi:hypothetical protein
VAVPVGGERPSSKRTVARDATVAFLLSIACGACASSSAPAVADDAGGVPDGVEGGDASSPWSVDGGEPPEPDGIGHPAPVDGGYVVGDASTLAEDRFVTGVVSFQPGSCAGFGASWLPGIVEGPPVGAGSDNGSTDCASLGGGGSIVLSFAPNAIVDGPGPDFIVFENPFRVSGDSNDVYAEPGEVSVSDDGTTWQTFPCAPTADPSAPHGTGVAPPYGQCAGWHVVWSSPGNGISPTDPDAAGGDAFDLADLGVTHARYVRIVDKTLESCADAGPRSNTNGFDLDAVSIVHAELP